MTGIDDLKLRDWTPRSQLRAVATAVDHPAVPCIDAHNHLGRWLSEDGDWIIPDVDELLRVMDDRHVELMAMLLDGGFKGGFFRRQPLGDIAQDDQFRGGFPQRII